MSKLLVYLTQIKSYYTENYRQMQAVDFLCGCSIQCI